MFKLDAMQIIAHRGASYDAPENTLAAFSEAWQQGADGLETDIRLTCDGAIVCLHDATATRTTGTELAIAESALPECRRLDAGRWKGPQWAGERIPLLSEVLGSLPAGKRLHIEVKSGPEILTRLAEEIAESAVPLTTIALFSFHEDVVADVKTHIPEINTAWLIAADTDGKTLPAPGLVRKLKALNTNGVGIDVRHTIDQALVNALRAAGMDLHVWAIDDPATAIRLRDLGIDSLTTNRPEFIRNAFTACPIPPNGPLCANCSAGEQRAVAPPNVDPEEYPGRDSNTRPAD